jgi:hypothetical protein
MLALPVASQIAGYRANASNSRRSARRLGGALVRDTEYVANYVPTEGIRGRR